MLRPLLFNLSPETAHELALHTLPLLLGTRTIRKFVSHRTNDTQFGPLDRFGLTFSNPVGLAAGFDKNGIALQALAALGFGHIEAGTVTNKPQPGNPKPRLFRLPADQALINRAGFNNDGAVAFAARVKKARPDCILGVSIGKSRAAAEDAIVEDHIQCFRSICDVADYVAVNVSSPNTPGLRDLQRAEQLEVLIQALQTENKAHSIEKGRKETPLLIKLAPDLELNDLELIVDVARRQNVAGLIATNTTVSREGLKTPAERVTSYGAGGLSGAPLRARSTQMIADLYRLCAGSMKIIGVGGIFSAEDAWDKICAGASLVQLYTGFIYRGPLVAKHINRGLLNILRREQIDSIDQAVGCRATEISRLS